MTSESFDDSQQRIQFLRLAIALTAGGCAGFLLVLSFIVPEGHSIRAIGAVLMLLVSAAAGLALWRARVEWSLRILCFGAWGVVTVMCVLAEGLRSPIAFTYPAIIMLSGWLLGKRTAIIVGLLTVAAGLAIALAMSTHILQPIPPAPPLVTWLVQAIIVAVVLAMLMLIISERDGQIGRLQNMAQEVREQHDFHETLVRAQSDAGLGMFVVAMGKITYVNEAACRIFGYAPEEIKSLPSYLGVIHPDEHKRISANHQRRIRGEQFENSYRTAIITKKGARREIAMTVGYLETGKMPRVLAVIQDITERVQAEAALSQTEEKFAKVFQASPIPISLARFEDGRFVDINPAFELLFGWPRDEVVGRTSTEIGLWRSVEDRLAWVRELRHAGSTQRFEVDWSSQSGEQRICQISAEVIQIEGEDHILALTNDITDSKRIEQALQANQVRLSEAQRIGRFGSWELDLAKDSFIWSEEINRIFEATAAPGTVNYATFLRMLHPDDRETFDRAFRQAIAEGRTGEYTYRLQMRDGRIKHVHVRAETIVGADGTPLKSIGTTQDVTGQEQAKAEIERLNAELEDRVRERTAELQSANKELESFAYSISHDLRAPLRGIDGFSHLLAEEYGERLDAQGKSYLERVRAAAQRMGTLIDDILELSRVSRHSMRRGQVDLSRLAREIVEEQAHGAPERAVEVAIAEGCTAFGDPQLLRVMMQNLLENAWKYSGKEAAPKIEFGRETRDGEAVFFVRDNGVGFDMKYADRLFTPFQRLHKPEEFAGTGIGLATVARIVRRHGGRVWAESAPGQGATLRLTLGTPSDKPL